jgi:hypothetical protein
MLTLIINYWYFIIYFSVFELSERVKKVTTFKIFNSNFIETFLVVINRVGWEIKKIKIWINELEICHESSLQWNVGNVLSEKF